MAHRRHPHPPTPLLWGVGFCLLLLGCQPCPETTQPTADHPLRIATFNTALSRAYPNALRDALADGDDPPAKRVAEVLQRTRPDIVLLQEVDYDPTGETYRRFQEHYLGVSQNGAEPIAYRYVYAPPVNTGELSGVDLNGDGTIAAPQDAHGWGEYAGRYGMVVLSRYPIDQDAVRTYRNIRWIDADPDALAAADYYSGDAAQRLRLSSKTHADVPVHIAGQTLHLLVAHPTPPVFDGPEDRNGYRNAAEIKLWADILDLRAPPRAGGVDDPPGWLISDQGSPAALRADARFVILGDLNADPNDGDSRPGAIQVLLDHPRVRAIAPASEGAEEQARLDGGANTTHRTHPATDTADWADDAPRGSGNLRVDYALPSATLRVLASGVYWPTHDAPHAHLRDTSDHRLVWIAVAWETGR